MVPTLESSSMQGFDRLGVQRKALISLWVYGVLGRNPESNLAGQCPKMMKAPFTDESFLSFPLDPHQQYQ